jgi:hypothetical protein
VEQVIVANCESIRVSENYFDKLVACIVVYHPLVGNFSVDVPEIVTAAGKAPTDVFIRHVMPASAHPLSHAIDTCRRGIKINKSDGDVVPRIVCPLQKPAKCASRERRFDDEVVTKK